MDILKDIRINIGKILTYTTLIIATSGISSATDKNPEYISECNATVNKIRRQLPTYTFNMLSNSVQNNNVVCLRLSYNNPDNDITHKRILVRTMLDLCDLNLKYSAKCKDKRRDYISRAEDYLAFTNGKMMGILDVNLCKAYFDASERYAAAQFNEGLRMSYTYQASMSCFMNAQKYASYEQLYGFTRQLLELAIKYLRSSKVYSYHIGKTYLDAAANFAASIEQQPVESKTMLSLFTTYETLLMTPLKMKIRTLAQYLEPIRKAIIQHSTHHLIQRFAYRLNKAAIQLRVTANKQYNIASALLNEAEQFVQHIRNQQKKNKFTRRIAAERSRIQHYRIKELFARYIWNIQNQHEFNTIRTILMQHLSRNLSRQFVTQIIDAANSNLNDNNIKIAEALLNEATLFTNRTKQESVYESQIRRIANARTLINAKKADGQFELLIQHMTSEVVPINPSHNNKLLLMTKITNNASQEQLSRFTTRLHALAEQYAAKATSNNKLLTIADNLLTVANKFIKSITNEDIKGSLSEKQIEIARDLCSKQNLMH